MSDGCTLSYITPSLPTSFNQSSTVNGWLRVANAYAILCILQCITVMLK